MSMNNKVKQEIIAQLIEHSRLIYSVISDMAVYYSSWIEDREGNKESLKKKRHKMQLSEEDADDIKIRLIQDYSQADLARDLGDYMTLALRMDNVINCALEFVDLLAFIDMELNEQMQKRFHKLINKLIEMADTFKLTIKNLQTNPDKVFENTTMIHEIENRIDTIFRDFLNYIYDNKSLGVRPMLKIRDSITILEEMADRIHDIADLIRVIIHK
ncbi:MAG: DUF47 family protein [Promethearchaeia archaeon]